MSEASSMRIRSTVPWMALTVALTGCSATGSSRVSLERSGAGSEDWVLTGDPHIPRLTFDMTRASFQVGSHVSIVALGDSPERLRCRHIAILNDTEGRAAGAAALGLLDKLREVPSVEKIDYYPPGHELPRGERLPDLVLRMSLGHHGALWLPFYYSASLKAAVDTMWSPLLARQIQPNHWPLPTPWVQYSFRIDTKVDCSFLGVSIRKVRRAARKLGEELGAQVARGLTAIAETRGALGTLPEYVWGAYRELDRSDMPVLDRPGVREVLSGSAPLHRNMSVFRLVDSRPRSEAMQEIAGEMTKAGWAHEDVPPGNPGEIHFWKGSRQVLSQAEKENALLDVVLTAAAGQVPMPPPRKADTPSPGAYHVHVSERVPDAELGLVLRRLLEDPGVSTEDLLAFGEVYRHHSRSLWTELMKRMQGLALVPPGLAEYIDSANRRPPPPDAGSP